MRQINGKCRVTFFCCAKKSNPTYLAESLQIIFFYAHLFVIINFQLITMTKIMNTNSLLALLLGLQNVDANRVPNLKKIARLVEFNSTPEKIQAQIDLTLAKNAQLEQAYQTVKADLDLAKDIPTDMLPSEVEIKPFLPQATARGGKPGQYVGNGDEIDNVLKISKVILNHETPQTISKSLLKRLNNWLKQQKSKQA